MKEDIKILEEYLDKQDRKFVSEHRLMILQAVENLIARYKDLEKNYINPNKARISYFDKSKGTKVVIEGFIPKSKVKEILNKLSNHNYKCNFDDVDFLQNIIIELQQLLED